MQYGSLYTPIRFPGGFTMTLTQCSLNVNREMAGLYPVWSMWLETSSSAPDDQDFRFPPESMSHTVWLSVRFLLTQCSQCRRTSRTARDCRSL